MVIKSSFIEKYIVKQEWDYKFHLSPDMQNRNLDK